MTGWTAVVPIKPAGQRKSRLAPRLSLSARIALSEAMLAHVLATLARSPAVAEIALLSGARPCGWSGGWIDDRGASLNDALAIVAHRMSSRLVVLHADLPALTPDDLDALVGQAGDGAAIAPDRHGRGTNALALASPNGAAFAFGAESLRHHRAAWPDATIVRRSGLALDIDDADDLAEGIRLGVLSGEEARVR